MLSWFRCSQSELDDAYPLHLDADVLRKCRRSQSLEKPAGMREERASREEVDVLVEASRIHVVEAGSVCQSSSSRPREQRFQLPQPSSSNAQVAVSGELVPSSQDGRGGGGQNTASSAAANAAAAITAASTANTASSILYTTGITASLVSGSYYDCPPVEKDYNSRSSCTLGDNVYHRTGATNKHTHNDELCGFGALNGRKRRYAIRHATADSTGDLEEGSQGGRCSQNATPAGSPSEKLREYHNSLSIYHTTSNPSQLSMSVLYPLPIAETRLGMHEATSEPTARTSFLRPEYQEPYRFRPEIETQQGLFRSKVQVATSFDGSTEPPTGPQEATDPQNQVAARDGEGSTGVRSVYAPATKNVNSTGVKPGLKVADRIRKFEQKAAQPTPATASQSGSKTNQSNDPPGSGGRVQRTDSIRGAKDETPLVFPLHVRKFRRRVSRGSPFLRADTPLYRSQPGDEPYLHAPTPQRKSTLVSSTPPETPPPLEAGEDLAELALRQANEEAAKADRSRQSQIVESIEPDQQPLSANAATVSSTRLPPANAEATTTQQAAMDLSKKPVTSPAPKELSSAPARRESAYTKNDISDLTPQLHNPIFSSRLLSPTLSKQRVNPTAHFHGTRGTCVRHGRKYSQNNGRQESTKATKDLYAKSRGGAYLPVGLPQLTNLEATSPWRYLTNCTDTSKSYSDACPDCVTELHIRKREVDQGAEARPQPFGQDDAKIEAANDGSPSLTVPEPAKEPQSARPQTETPGQGEVLPAGSSAVELLGTNSTGFSRGETFGSTLVEPASSARSSPRSASGTGGSDQTASADGDKLAPNPTGSGVPSTPGSVKNTPGTGDDGEQPRLVRQRTKSVHFRDPSRSSEGDRLIISRDLGEGYDAMILERGGRLERLVMNSRHGQPSAETMAKIARELLMVSSTLNEANSGPSPESCATSETERTVVVDRGFHYEHAREASTDDVINLFDEATGTLEPGLVMMEPWQLVHEDAEGIHATPSPNQHSPHPHNVEEDYEALREHFGVNGPYTSFAGTDDDLPSNAKAEQSKEGASRWPIPLNTSFASAHSIMTDRYRDSTEESQPLPAIRVRSRASDLGSEEAPVTIPSTRTRKMSPRNEPTLPSHVLRAQDTASPTEEAIPMSPLIFTASTAPSLGEPSPLTEPALPAIPENPASPATVFAPGSPAPSRTEEAPGAFPSLTRADSKVIRHVMRMEIQNKAVHEAAEKERQARRQRSILAEAKRALGFQ